MLTDQNKQYIRKNRFTLILGLIGLSILIYLVVFSYSQRRLYKEMDSNGLIDSAIVIRNFTGAKRKLYFEYEFIIDKKTYNGFLQYSPSNGPVSIGDTFLVKYLESDPDDVNELIKNKDYLLIKP